MPFTPVISGEDGDESFGVMNLDELLDGFKEDFDFLAEGVIDDMVTGCSAASTI